jgi:hypothetical protein
MTFWVVLSWACRTGSIGRKASEPMGGEAGGHPVGGSMTLQHQGIIMSIAAKPATLDPDRTKEQLRQRREKTSEIEGGTVRVNGVQEDIPVIFAGEGAICIVIDRKRR